MSLLSSTIAGEAALADADLQWFRGQLHCHSYWSDGRGFPEQAIAAYKDRGYQFVCITDHNRFAKSPEKWREVVAEEGGWPPNVSQAIFDAYVATCGREWVETRTEQKNDKPITRVRLKTHEELKARFEEPDEFLLLPGVEITQTVNGLGLHMNYINLPLILPCIEGAGLIKTINGPSVSDVIALNASEARLAAAELDVPHMVMLNHPFWVYYDIVPQNLIDRPEIRFFEIGKGGFDYFHPHPEAPDYTIDKFWDIVNAFRCIQGHPLLYGVASDDAHFYDPERITAHGGADVGWVMVRAGVLRPERLIAAMERGDFYSSTGVFLEDVTFDPENKTLRVRVQAEGGVNYKINFITTKTDFDRTVNEITSPAGQPPRAIPVYSDDIGRTVKTVNGTEGACQMAPDDLYIRARVDSDAPRIERNAFHPKVKMAWTQPYTDEVPAEEESFTVVMLGDSTTLCRDSEPDKKLTGLVQAHLADDFKLNVNVVNAGVGSDTIKGGFQRLQRHVFKHDPDLVTISFGLNDTGLLTPEEFDEFLVKAVDAIQAESKAKVLLVTSTPFVNAKHFWNARFAEEGGLDEYMDANICAKMRALAEKRNLPICDLHTLFKAEFKKDAALESKVIRSDGVHLTDEGNALAARYLAPAIAGQLPP